VVLIKAFLPRYDTVKGGFITRIFTFNTPQFAEELVPRTEALELFYKNFEINDKSNSVLNSDFRVSSFVKMHNSITAKLNRNKESNIYQTYPKHINAQSKAEEAYIYESIIRGETIPSPLPNLELSCSALFAG
jgi:hypothetical protein